MGAYENALGTPAEHIVITNDSLVVLEDASSTIDLLDNDLILNITSFTLAIVDSADNGTIALVGDTALTYTPDENFFGYDTLSYRVFSSETADTGLVLITVIEVNDAPIASDASFSTDEDVAVEITLTATDADGDYLTYVVVDSPAYGTVSDSGYSLSFDGDADYVELHNSQFFNDISAMVWVKTDYNGTQKRIIDYDGGWGNDMFIVGVENGYPMVKLREDTNSPLQLTGSSMITNNEWHHIAYVRDGNQNYFYVDGVLEDNSEGNEFLVDNTVNIFISSSTPSKEFDGNIDEVAIWSIALNSSQIQSFMASSPTGDETGLVGYWNFNEGRR